MHKPWSRLNFLKRHRHSGQVLIMVALAMTVLVGFVAMSVDVGYAMAQRRQVQTAVDAAAIAAANAALANASTSDVINTAKSYGADNADVPTSDVTVVRPPTTGAHAGDSNYIQVSITKDVPRLFSGIVYKGPWKVSASAMSAIIPAGFDAAILALNGGSGGIKTAGSSTIKVTGNGSIVSNYDINTSGSTLITADGWVAASKGFHTSGSTTITGGLGTNQSSAQIPDPLLTAISPPTLPTFPSNPIADVNPASASCLSKPGWWPTPQYPGDYTASSGTYSGGSKTCINISGSNANSTVFEFLSGNYKFAANTGINISFDKVQMDGGTYIFNGSNGGITVGGSTPAFDMKAGNYAFLTGSSLNIGGSALNNVLCDGATKYSDCTFYFSGGGGILAGGSNNITLYPGTYIFDGGKGLNMSGSDRLTFMPGTYKFYFGDGADLSFSGSSNISLSGSPYVQAYFYGNSSASTSDQCPNNGNSGSNSSDLCMSGSSNFNIPSGQYYFDNGRLLDTGSSKIAGSNVFLYFKDKSYLYSSGSASFGFTAPTTTIYPGYFPGVFMYADRSNNSTFTWTGSTSSVSQGIVYLPDSKLVMTGSSNGKIMTGQIIANSFDLSGSNNTQVQYQKYVATSIPAAYLVQ